MAEDMTHDQALQELGRFANLWQATSQLKEALTVAANAESAVKRLERERRQLEEKVRLLSALVTEKDKESKEIIETAEAKAKTKLQELQEHHDKRKQEYATHLARREQEAQNAIRHLEEAIAAKREEMNGTFAALDEEIAEKRAIIAELNEQLDNLRKRLG